jgi:hypothetical protein
MIFSTQEQNFLIILTIIILIKLYILLFWLWLCRAGFFVANVLIKNRPEGFKSAGGSYIFLRFLGENHEYEKDSHL